MDTVPPPEVVTVQERLRSQPLIQRDGCRDVGAQELQDQGRGPVCPQIV